MEVRWHAARILGANMKTILFIADHISCNSALRLAEIVASLQDGDRLAGPQVLVA